MNSLRRPSSLDASSEKLAGARAGARWGPGSRRPGLSHQSVSYFTVPPRAHPSTGSQSGSATPGQPATRRPSQNWMPCLGPTSQRRSPLSSSHFPRTVSSMSHFERSCTRCVYSAICPLSSGRSSVIQGAPLAWLRRIIFCGTRLRHAGNKGWLHPPVSQPPGVKPAKSSLYINNRQPYGSLSNVLRRPAVVEGSGRR